MLAGDAASLIDPATGEGIGNAMLSARIAAEVAAKCLEADNFSASFLKQYDRTVYGKLWPELRNKYLIQRLLKDRAWLIDLLVGQVANSPILQNITKRIF
jgi:menaquinone-9 beta-reductase